MARRYYFGARKVSVVRASQLFPSLFTMCMNMANLLFVWRLHVKESQTVKNDETTKENKSH